LRGSRTIASETGDDLGQWRAYTDNGRGYALGFGPQALEAAFIRQRGAPIQEAFPVTYNYAVLTDIQRSIIEKMFDLISLPRGKGLADDAIKGYVTQLYTLTTVHALHIGRCDRLAGPTAGRVWRPAWEMAWPLV
jgi:hypothetical protein